jgi:predicted enzyme related to lactoylglutathione lyase
MGERTSYPPGAFSWAEPATSDADAAKSFYSTLFGWDYEDNPIGDGQVYSMASRDTTHGAALFGSAEPPHWNCYATVASVDEATARAGELGGTVLDDRGDARRGQLPRGQARCSPSGRYDE